MKIDEFIENGKLVYLTILSTETSLFYLEIVTGTVIPVFLLARRKFREDKKWLYIISVCVISGFILNRINVAITGFTASSGVNYFPSFDEISITMMLVTLALIAFRIIAKNFSLFAGNEEPAAILKDRMRIINNN